MKNIIIFSDGTGNTTIKNRGTNVFKMYEAVELEETDIPQVVIYDDGVGTEDLKPVRIIGGAFGYGLSRNVRQLYAALVRAYRPGDKIYLFGFSRGAFTVRYLAALICNIGIIDKDRTENRDDPASPLLIPTDGELQARVYQAFRELREKNRAWLEMAYAPVLSGMRYLLGFVGLRQIFPRFYLTIGPEKFSEQYCHDLSAKDTKDPVKLIGVWDTVCAVGLPFTRLARYFNKYIYHYTFSEHSLHPSIAYAYQALSIDDQRATFHPEIWDESKKQEQQKIEQVWFAGVHANVGGGYPKQGMSLVALDWMLEKAQLKDDKGQVQGVRFTLEDLAHYKAHKNVHDKLYDSRAGLAFFYRYKPRDIHKLCQDRAVLPQIHASVIERIQLGSEGYAPGNLPRRFTVVDWRNNDMNKATSWKDIVGDMQKNIPDTKNSLLDEPRMRIYRDARRSLCWVAILCLLVAVYLVLPQATGIGDLLSSSFYLSTLAQLPLWVYESLAVCFLLASLFELKMRERFSSFWHRLTHANGRQARPLAT